MKKIFFLLFIIILTVLGISFYLNIDDLEICGSSPDNDIVNCQAVDAIVVVSGGNTKSRVDEAVKLYNNGWSKRLIFSGAALDKNSPSNASAMKDIAVKDGVPILSIWLDEYSNNTSQNAQNTKTIFKELSISSAILITSGYHQRRADLEFSRRINDVQIINHSTTTDPDWSPHWWWVKPRGWWLASSELVKIIFIHLANLVKGSNG